MYLQIRISVNFHTNEYWIRILYSGNPTEIFCQTSATRWGRTRNRRRDRNVFRDSTEILEAIFENDRIGTRFFQIMWSFYEWETHLLFPTSDWFYSQNWRIFSLYLRKFHPVNLFNGNFCEPGRARFAEEKMEFLSQVVSKSNLFCFLPISNPFRIHSGRSW